MLSDLNAVVAACTVNEKLVVDIDGNVVYLHPAFAFARAATPVVGAIALAAGSVLAGKEDKIARLKLRSVSEQHINVSALLRHTC